MGQGKLYAGERGLHGAVEGYRFLGNVSALDIMLGRGITNSGLARVVGDHPRIQFTLESLSRENLELVMGGNSYTAAGAFTTGNVVVRKGMMVPLPHINLAWFSDLRTQTNEAISPAYYEVDLRSGSIQFSADSPLTDGQVLTAAYTHAGSSVIGAYDHTPRFFSLRFEGINQADAESPVVCDIYKVQLEPVDALSLIGDNFSSLQVTGRVFADSIHGGHADEGRYLRIRRT
jgi:hypothetical protein